MALDFPGTPSDGDIYEQYKWNDTDGVWELNNPEYVGYLYLEALVVAGGASGGESATNSAGGGGAGGYVSTASNTISGGLSVFENPIEIVSGDSFTVTVGAGGARVGDARGTNGSDSVFGSITAVGGGGGGSQAINGVGIDGGSGGGACYGVDSSAHLGGLPSTNQGFRGGNKASSGIGMGAGGGGAGGQGEDVSSQTGGDGGPGIASTITGSLVYRAGGGGGVVVAVAGGTGGIGGGGTGANSGTAGSGDANSGGGGGAASNGAVAGNGGSGVVILKYPAIFSLTVGVGLTSSTTTVGDYKVTEFTAGSDTVTVA